MTNEEKIYSIAMIGGATTHLLMQLQADVFHGLACLKGIECAGGKSAGKQIYLPASQIAAITEYESWSAYAGPKGKSGASGEKKKKSKKKK